MIIPDIRIMKTGGIETSLIFLILQISGSEAISCTAILQSLDCLPAFSHAPAILTKCYCSSLCPSIEFLRQGLFRITKLHTSAAADFKPLLDCFL